MINNTQAISFLLVVFGFILVLFINDFRITFLVKKHSARIAQLVAFNQTYKFKEDLNLNPLIVEYFNSKKQLHDADFDHVIRSVIERNQEFYLNILKTLDFNNELYLDYFGKVKNIKSSFNEKDAKSLFTSLSTIAAKETIYFNKIMLKPGLDIKLTLALKYMSKKGRKIYWRRNTYHYFEIKSFYQEVIANNLLKETRAFQMKVERNKLKASLRYQILMRDKKTCQICGANSKDGAILHVDHIVPVAKGGKSIAENLRTLCERCNLGKKDKLEVDF
jgi:hypothetical protein